MRCVPPAGFENTRKYWGLKRWGLRIAASEPLGPRDGSKSAPGGHGTLPAGLENIGKYSKKTGFGAAGASESLLRSYWGLETAPRALREASRQPQERSWRLQDSSKSALGGLKTAPRALWEASRRLQERSGRPQDAPRALRDASRRLQERSGRLKTAQRALWEA